MRDISRYDSKETKRSKAKDYAYMSNHEPTKDAMKAFKRKPYGTNKGSSK